MMYYTTTTTTKLRNLSAASSSFSVRRAFSNLGTPAAALSLSSLPEAEGAGGQALRRVLDGQTLELGSRRGCRAASL